MNKFLKIGAALLLTTTAASAGGLDRSGQAIGTLFKDGNYVELSFGNVTPSLAGSGLNSTFNGAASTGNIAPSYTSMGAAYKRQLTDQASMALILDQPFGAEVNYNTAGHVLSGSSASVSSNGVTALARYEATSKLSVHGGLRIVSAEGSYNRPVVGATPAYASTYSSDSGTGYVIGGAYERDDIAMRIALTYSSEIDLALDGTNGNLSTTLPDSLNLDFQTGIAADTLLFGSIRRVSWAGFSLDDSDPSSGGSILSYDDDVTTLNIGVGRRFTDNFSASLSVGYEKSTGELAGNLGPTDGFMSYQIGGSYTMDSGMEISGGIRFVNLGDANTAAPVGGVFANNDAIGLGLKVGYAF
jgi:long-chain fatty acid transport protein